MSDQLNCPSCGRLIDSRDVYCTFCGSPVAPPPHSGEQGGSLEAAESPAEPAPAAAPSDDVIEDGETPWEPVLKQLRTVTQGRYEIERELGQGGMAAVYLAHEFALDRRVAIKVMSPAVLMERGTVGRFKQEAITIAALKHPHIVTVHAVEHHEQLHYFVLDYVEGGSLERVIRQTGPLPIPIVCAWLSQVASALEYAHKRGVVHRDVKPANILLDSEGDAIVTDFGIAKVTEKKGYTATGFAIGTPSYMSPEQCLGKAVTGASDQYSLGVVAYEMLTGAPPFTGSILEVMQAHNDTPPPDLLGRRPDCPSPLALAVMRMLEKDPPARWDSLTDVVAAYGGTLPGLHDPVRQTMAALARGERPSGGVAAGPVTPPTPGAGILPGLKRHWRALGLGTAVVAAAAVGLTLLTRSPDSPSEPEPLPPPVVVASLEITPIPESLDPGETLQLSAVLRDSAGATVTGEAVEWSSSDEGVVQVTDGRLEARRPGTAQISASGGGQARSVEVLVRAPPSPESAPYVASVRLDPGALSLVEGDTASLSATALDASGRRLAGRRVSWSVADATVASVSADGQVRALAPGTTEVLATIDGRRARGSITVTLEGRQLQWQSSNESVATVSATGIVTARAAGIATISATAEGRSGQATVTVERAAEPIDDAEAGRQIGAWISAFARDLDAAVRARDLAMVRSAYEAPMPEADVREWQRRFQLDARWRTSLARTYPARRIGSSWVSDFELEVQVEAAGRTTSGPQRFLAVFEPQDGRLAITSLEMRLSEEQ
jgi:serine/threonine-protein kinase